MRINVGDPAPPVGVEAYVRDGANPVAMEIGGSGGSWTVLFFYPRDFAFVTPAELRGFAELEADFAREDATVVAASTDSWYVHRAWLGTTPGLRAIDYPVVADPAQELTRLYGVLDHVDGAARSATFIIDPDGIVRHAAVDGEGIGRHPEETLGVLQALRACGQPLQLAA